jgi:hypothetical protein
MNGPTLSNRDLAHDAHGHGCFAIDLEGRVQSFNASIRDALIARGVLYRDTEDMWRLRWSGFDLKREQAAWMAVCDFCSARPVTWTLECRPFEMPGVRGGPPFVSPGDWAACATCGDLVRQGNRAALLPRMCAQIDPRWPAAIRRDAHRLRRGLADLFWRHYTGRAVPESPHPFGY